MRLLPLVAMVGCACVGVFAQGTTKQTPTPTQTPQQYVIRSQPDAPLRIASAQATWAIPGDQRGVQIYIVVENVGQQAVHAYTTRRDGNTATEPKGCLGNPALGVAGLLPGEKRGTSTWEGVTHYEPSPTIWIDFVQFSDGTRWGADECQTADWIDGSRTGTVMLGDRLLAILREKGADELIGLIKQQRQIPRTRGVESEQLPVPAPAGHSPRWEEGYNGAAARLIQDVFDGYRRGGAAEINRILMGVVEPAKKQD